jgi:hypothetical protein
MPTAHLSRPDSILPGAEFYKAEASTLLTTRELCRRLAISGANLSQAYKGGNRRVTETVYRQDQV